MPPPNLPIKFGVWGKGGPLAAAGPGVVGPVNEGGWQSTVVGIYGHRGGGLVPPPPNPSNKILCMGQKGSVGCSRSRGTLSDTAAEAPDTIGPEGPDPDPDRGMASQGLCHGRWGGGVRWMCCICLLTPFVGGSSFPQPKIKGCWSCRVLPPKI